MRGWIIAALLIALMLPVSFILINAANYVFYSSGGLDEQLDEQAQKTMKGDYLTNWNEERDDIRFGWELTGVLIIGVLILLLIIGALSSRRRRTN